MAHSFNPVIFKAYDIYGTVGTELVFLDAFVLGRVLGAWLYRNETHEILISYDDRPSSPALVQELVRGLYYTGLKMMVVGRGSVPMLWFYTHTGKFDCAVMVTSPCGDRAKNGFYMTYHQRPMAASLMENLRKMALSGSFPMTPGGAVYAADGRQAYVDWLGSQLQAHKGTERWRQTIQATNVLWVAEGPILGSFLSRLTAHVPPAHHIEILNLRPNRPARTHRELLLELQQRRTGVQDATQNTTQAATQAATQAGSAPLPFHLGVALHGSGLGLIFLDGVSGEEIAGELIAAFLAVKLKRTLVRDALFPEPLAAWLEEQNVATVLAEQLQPGHMETWVQQHEHAHDNTHDNTHDNAHDNAIVYRTGNVFTLRAGRFPHTDGLFTAIQFFDILMAEPGALEAFLEQAPFYRVFSGQERPCSLDLFEKSTQACQKALDGESPEDKKPTETNPEKQPEETSEGRPKHPSGGKLHEKVQEVPRLKFKQKSVILRRHERDGSVLERFCFWYDRRRLSLSWRGELYRKDQAREFYGRCQSVDAILEQLL